MKLPAAHPSKAADIWAEGSRSCRYLFRGRSKSEFDHASGRLLTIGVMAYRPLSRRGKSDPLYDESQEGIPAYMLESILGWITTQLRSRSDPAETMRMLQLGVRHMTPLEWYAGTNSAVPSLKKRVEQDGEIGLDVIDFFLRFVSPPNEAERLNVWLRFGGSAWEVTPVGQGQHHLTRRAIGPVRDSIDSILPISERAHHHLTTAWSRLMGRDPDPSTAYREAIRAVEVVAKPVVTPKDSNATLGKMIRALEAKPEKWNYVLEGTTATDVADMAASIWTGQLDRHGTDDESEPLHVSQEQADAAFHVALALTRIFAGRLLDTA